MTGHSLEALAAPLRDLGRTNRLVALPSDRRSGYVSFAAPARSVWERLSRGDRVSFSDPVLAARRDWSDPHPCVLEPGDVGSRLVRLDGLARDMAEESGVSPLMLGLGLVAWRDGEAVRLAPLALCPVVLDGVPGDPGLRGLGVPVVNPVILDRLEIDPRALPSDPLAWDRADLARFGVVDVVPVAVLGLFDLAAYRQWQRVSGREGARLERDARVTRLLSRGRSGTWSSGGRGLTRDPALTVSLDRSQALVVRASRRGLDVAVEGGPGTGKTQTIAHVLGNALRDRRTVLFLSGRVSAFRAVLAGWRARRRRRRSRRSTAPTASRDGSGTASASFRPGP